MSKHNASATHVGPAALDWVGVMESWRITPHVQSVTELLQPCSHCFSPERIFKEMMETFLLHLKRGQHFLSQNNLSLFLTRQPAIFTQLKSQMIYFQLHNSRALCHMLLSIMLGRTKQPLARHRAIEQKQHSRDLAWPRNLEGTNSYFPPCLPFCVSKRRCTRLTEWNYRAFIMQAAGAIWKPRNSPPTSFSNE